MPVHDWSRVSAGTFHDFHVAWTEYVNVPLEETYQAAWRGLPKRWKRVLEA